MYWWWHGSVNFRIRIECNIYSCVVYLHFHRAIHVFFQFFPFFENASTFSRSDFNRIGGENEDTNDCIVFMFPLFIDISLRFVIYLSLVGNSQKHMSISILIILMQFQRSKPLYLYIRCFHTIHYMLGDYMLWHTNIYSKRRYIYNISTVVKNHTKHTKNINIKRGKRGDRRGSKSRANR